MTCNLFSVSRRRRGSLLIVVMWVSFGLVALLIYFAKDALETYRASENAAAALQAEQSIEGARRYLLHIFDNVVEEGEAPSIDDDEYVAEGIVGEGIFWIIGRDNDAVSEPDEPAIGLVDECSKLNVNEATGDMLEELFDELPETTSDMVAAIIDWRDDDEDITDGGAESLDYEMLDEPYECKNADFESLEELRLVMDVDMEIIWGEDVNCNGLLDANENDGDENWPNDNGDGILDCGLAEYLTCWSREPNTTDNEDETFVSFGGGDIEDSLTELLEDALGSSSASSVIAAVGDVSEILSPLEFYYKSGLSDSQYQEIENSLGAGEDDYRIGPVNVNTAPLEVLACLPGMNNTLAQSLVTARSGLSEDERESAAWVTTVITDESTITEIGPWLTNRSYQYSADIAAVGRNGRGFQRSFMVFDREEDETAVIYRRDRTRLGWPLGETVRENLKTLNEETIEEYIDN